MTNQLGVFYQVWRQDKDEDGFYWTVLRLNDQGRTQTADFDVACVKAEVAKQIHQKPIIVVRITTERVEWIALSEDDYYAKIKLSEATRDSRDG